jgi:hypothetical protein
MQRGHFIFNNVFVNMNFYCFALSIVEEVSVLHIVWYRRAHKIPHEAS